MTDHARLRELLAAATPEDWLAAVVLLEPNDGGPSIWGVWPVHDKTSEATICECYGPNSQHDAELIAALRNAAPGMIADSEEERRIGKRLLSLIDECNDLLGEPEGTLVTDSVKRAVARADDLARRLAAAEATLNLIAREVNANAWWLRQQALAALAALSPKDKSDG